MIKNLYRWIRYKSHLSLRNKAIVYVTVLQIALFLVLTYVLVDNFHLMTEQMFENHFIQMAEVLGTGNKNALIERDQEHLEREISQLNRQKDILYAVIHDAGGNVLAGESDSSIESAGAHHTTGEMSHGPGSSTVRKIGPKPGGFFHESGHNLEIQVPIFIGSTLIGTVKLGVTTEQYNQQLAEYSKNVMGLLLLSFLVVGLLLYYVDRRVRKVLQSLIQTTDVMTKGDLSKRVQITTRDELETLGSQFNAMADALEERNRQLEQHREELEQRVEERTKELRSERNKLRAIIDNVPSAFLLVDENRVIQAASENLHHIGGFQQNILVGKYCDPVLWENSMCEKCLIHHVFETGNTIKREHHTQDNGESKWLEQVIVPVKSGRKVNSVIEILTDITERKRLESQLIRSEKLATTGEMAAVIAHEVRNSLTSVKMILQLLYESNKFDEDDMESLRVSLDSMKRMERVVNDLLHFAQPRPFEKEYFRLNDVVHASIGMVQHQLESNSIEIRLELNSNLPPVIIDPKYMEEAFINILLNSIQAVQDTSDGVITIGTDMQVLSTSLSDTFVETYWESDESQKNAGDNRIPDEKDSTRGVLRQRKLQLTIDEGTSVVRVDIADNGHGFPDELGNRIFDPFYTTKFDGTGLGLSLVKRIVNGHRGVLSYYSEPGHHTRFTVFLPLREQTVTEHLLEND